jgi:type I restriction-modification system DNA methylase subunit
LEGTTFVQVGLKGALETDFFNWPLLVPGGEDLVSQIATQVARFRLSEIEADVLKTVYESLIDPQQRHYLGEYYTPDWLAEWICDRAVSKPLAQRVLDPACGSGTFLFHAVRKFLAAAERKLQIAARVAVNSVREILIS